MASPWRAYGAGAPKVLEGVKIVELATVIAAPSCCALLSDMGASVIKVEGLGVGDTWRLQNYTPDGAAAEWQCGPHFANNNRGKRSVQLNVKDKTHLAAFKKLLATADVFVTNVRPAALERSGLDYPTLAKEFPSMIYAICLAWGLDGPQKDDPGYDLGAFWAAGGLMDFSKDTDDSNVGTFPPGIGDHTTGVQLAAAIAMALYHRERTGQGQLVDACLLRAAIWGMAFPLMNTATALGKQFVRQPRTDAFNETMNTYKCADGQWLQLLGLDTKRFMPKMIQALGLDASKVQGLNHKQIIELFDSHFAKQPISYWEEHLKAAGMWYTRAKRLDEVIQDPQVLADGGIVPVPWFKYKVAGSPIKLGCSDRHGPAGPPPAPGQHTASVLREAGVDDAPIVKIMQDQDASHQRSKL